MRILSLFFLLLVANPASAVEAIVKDGDTIQIGNVAYKLAGLDAPEVDQPCVDEHADNWACGVEARDQLVKLIGKREVRCEDLGEDKIYKNRRAGLCSVVGETGSLNQAVIQSGYAVSIEPSDKASAKTSFKPDETAAKDKRQGLWRGCFVTPAEFRRKASDSPLLGLGLSERQGQGAARGAVSHRSRDAGRAAISGRNRSAGPSLPAMLASISFPNARITRPSRSRIAGFAARTTPAPRVPQGAQLSGPQPPQLSDEPVALDAAG